MTLRGGGISRNIQILGEQAAFTHPTSPHELNVGILNGHPAKISPDEIKEGVVQNCPLSDYFLAACLKHLKSDAEFFGKQA